MRKKEGKIIKEMNKDELVQYINSQPENSVTTVYFKEGDEDGEKTL